MGRVYTLRGHHIMNFKIFLFYLGDKTKNPKSREYFSKLVSSRRNLITIVDENDSICNACEFANLGYCEDGDERATKERVAQYDSYKADVWGLKIGDKIPVLDLMEKLVGPEWCTGMSLEDYLFYLSKGPFSLIFNKIKDSLQGGILSFPKYHELEQITS